MSDKRKASRPWIVVAMVTLVVPGVLFYLFAGDRPAPPDDALTSAPSAKISPADDRRSLSPRQDNQASDAPTLPTAIAAPQSAAGRAARSKADLDPARDGWDSEAASHLADQQLRLLAAKIKHPEQLTAAGLEPLLAPKFTCTPLQHESREIFNDSMFHVDKSDIDASSIRAGQADTHVGATGLEDALRSLIKPLEGSTERQVKFKVVAVKLGNNRFVTRQLLSITARTPSEMVEQHATWMARWVRSSRDAAPLLQWIGLEDFTQAHLRIGDGPLFTDCTASVLETNPEYRSQLSHGIDDWLQRFESMLTGPFGHHGLALGDVNADGFDDLYVCQPGGLPNLLLMQNQDATVTNQAASAGVDLLDFSRSALLLDLDNDGDQDLIVATLSQLHIFSNDGKGNFARRAQMGQVRDAHSLAAADYDHDGRLDIYVCAYSGDGGVSRQSPTPIPIHDARNGGRNVLLRNTETPEAGDWKFVDVTDNVGLDQANGRWSYAAAWEDYDADGDSDIYVANDFGRNSLHRNDDGRFTDVSEEAGLAEAAFGMSVTWGDYDLDGLLDVYVSNMFSAAGNRVTAQTSFQPKAKKTLRRSLQYAARGNSLFRNQGDGTFRDVSVDAGVTMGRWAWSSLFSDVNNDGRPDLLVGNGFMTRDTADDL